MGLAVLFAAAWVLACGSGDPTDTSGQATGGASSSGGEPPAGTTAGPTSQGPTDGTSSPSTGDALTGSTTQGDTRGDTQGDTTDGEPSGCAPLCERSIACGVPVMLEACIADCESVAPLLQSCLLACDLAVCDDLLACTTACAEPGDPTAPPYGSCESECQPGVVVCIATSHPDGTELSVCAPYCDPDGQCPVPETGTAPPRCDLETNPPVCSLDCSAGQQCPEGMTCDDGFCSWLVP